MTFESRNKNPYVGPRPFEPQDRELFFGRDHEIREIRSLIIAHRTLLLYSQSGVGKSSLLNAGLIPFLIEDGFEVLPLARVGGILPPNLDAEIPNLYVFNTLMSWSEEKKEPESLVRMLLADFLKNRKHIIDNEGLLAPRVIIFDQFEELFTSYPERWRNRKEFFELLNDALEDDPLLRVIFAIREDYIAQLDPFASLLPERLRIRYRLERLQKEAALLAIKEPLTKTKRSFAEGVAEKLVKELQKVRIKTAAGETLLITEEFVEPVQLQVTCQNLWQDLPPDIAVITQEHLQTYGNVNQALIEFYEKSIKKASQESSLKEDNLRRWFEHILITPEWTRGTVYRGREETGSIPNLAVDILDNLHIIKGIVRGGARWYELTHDRFIEAIHKSNQRWRDSLPMAEKTKQFFETKATEWARVGRFSDNLLNESELHEAERWLESAKTVDLDYSETLLAFIQTSRAEIEKQRATAARQQAEIERKRREKEARTARRFRRLAIALMMMSILAVGLTIITWNLLKRAQISENKAKISEQKARKEALISESLEKEANAARDSALAQRNEAEVQRALALEAKVSAENSKMKAENLARREAEFRAESERLSFGYLARSLVKSVSQQIQNGDSTLAALLARQAYLFNLRYEGEIFNQEIYDALCMALGEPQILTGHKDWVRAVVFSPDGKILASASVDGTIQLWDIHSVFDKIDKAYAVLHGHKKGVRCLAFNSNGRILASAGDDHTIRLWNLKKPKSNSTVLKGHNDMVWTVAFDPKGKILASGSADSTVRIWEVDNINAKFIRQVKHISRIRVVTISPDGKWLASGGDNGIIYLRELKNLSESPKELRGHKGRINALAFSPDSRKIASGSKDRTVMLWDLSDPDAQAEVLSYHKSGVTSIKFSSDGLMLATGSFDGTIRLLDSRHYDSGNSLTLEHNSWIWCVAFSPDNQMIASGCRDNNIYIWKTKNSLLAQKICQKVQRNLNNKEWQTFLGAEIEYERTCPELLPGEAIIHETPISNERK